MVYAYTIQRSIQISMKKIALAGNPNVGKSTLINRLVGRKSAGVGNTPGFTKNLSWIRVNKDIELFSDTSTASQDTSNNKDEETLFDGLM